MAKIKDVLIELNIHQYDVLGVIDIKSLSTLNLKLNGKADFTTKEALKLKKYINSKSSKQYTLEDLFGDESEV